MKRQTSILAKPKVPTLGMVLFGSIFAIVGVVASIFLLIQTRTWYGLMPLLFTATGLFFIRVGRQMKQSPHDAADALLSAYSRNMRDVLRTLYERS
jgi:hypothetical protein